LPAIKIIPVRARNNHLKPDAAIDTIIFSVTKVWLILKPGLKKMPAGRQRQDKNRAIVSRRLGKLYE
jgi:hypothetical protein